VDAAVRLAIDDRLLAVDLEVIAAELRTPRRTWGR
jgi:hypothetical protein